MLKASICKYRLGYWPEGSCRLRPDCPLDAVLPDRSEAYVSAVLKQALSKTDVLLCTDGDPALIAFAKKEAIECELIIASHGEHVHEKVLHFQTVNSYMSRLKK